MRVFVFTSSVLFLVSLFSGCFAESEWEKIQGNSGDCLLVVFPSGTTIVEINAFLSQHTRGPRHPGGGYTHRPGIASVVNNNIGRDLAYLICFKPDAEAEQVATLLEELRNSPIVNRVLEGEEAQRAIRGEEL